MAELLVELFCEEIPARMQVRAAEDLKKLVTDRLDEAGLTYTSAVSHVTPRRLCLVIEDLPDRQPDQRHERRGPRIDAPDRAVSGFLDSVGLARDQVEERKTPKGTFLFTVVEKKGEDTRKILPGLLVDAIRSVSWPKSMRWGRNRFRWVRPLHHVLAVFDGETLDGGLPLGDHTLTFTNETRGHRFLAPHPVPVTGFDDYRTKLRSVFVILDRGERKTTIRSAARVLAEAEGLTLRDDPGLLDEVCGLVEWPVPLAGRIETVFMDLPAEVLVTAMRAHQKYFALETTSGQLAPRFITVSNTAASPERDVTIVAGNEKVLRARLSDARFFWDQDRRQTLESRVPALADVAFYDRLGTLADKVGRMESLAEQLAAFVPGCDPTDAGRAARLAKADLTTEMVGEFPTLQGLMGHYYALHDGEPAAVAQALAEHYAPSGPFDSCPIAPVSVAVALADKIDTLTGFFAINERPTGSRDPFALRRAALGVIRLVITNGLRLPLRKAVAMALSGYDGLGEPAGLLEFFVDRLKVHLRDRGVRHDVVAAVFALGDEDDLCRLIARIDALTGFLASDDGNNLLVAHRRAANIVRIEAAKDGGTYRGFPNPEQFEVQQEKVLHDAISTVISALSGRIVNEDFGGAMGILAELRRPIDTYFQDVTVNVEQPALRANRLETLASIVDTMNRVADFSKVEG